MSRVRVVVHLDLRVEDTATANELLEELQGVVHFYCGEQTLKEERVSITPLSTTEDEEDDVDESAS